MKREHLLAIGSTIGTLAVCLMVIRHWAPGLLGLPVDYMVVRSSKTVPPYFANIFRAEEIRASEFLHSDPQLSVRPKPFFPEVMGLGPHDLLGFRNRVVPQISDVIVIGDSQTYGNNVIQKENWPSTLATKLGLADHQLYSMASGGWGAVQYLAMFGYSFVFQPRVIVVAFYSGNDALETFRLTYTVDHWKNLRPDNKLKASDYPAYPFPAPAEDEWHLTWKDGTSMIFTPKLRLISNDNDIAAVRAGYQIILRTIADMSSMAKQTGTPVVFTVIPTKELSYSARLSAEGIEKRADFSRLVEHEEKNIEMISKAVKESGAQYVDLVTPLKEAAKSGNQLYPGDNNGHPIKAGYSVIAQEISKVIKSKLKKLSDGLYRLTGSENRVWYYQLREGNLKMFESDLALNRQGLDPKLAQEASLRDLADFGLSGVIHSQ